MFALKLQKDGKLRVVNIKEKLVPFDFDAHDCDVIITTRDKEVHLPSSFLEMVSNGQFMSKMLEIEVASEMLIKVLSFYCPKNSSSNLECKSVLMTFKPWSLKFTN